MSASPGANWQRSDLAHSFLHDRKTMLPLLDVQEDLVRRILFRHRHPVARFVDLGAGDGAMSETVLSVFADAEAVLVDFSEPMLSRVEQRLGSSQGRWRWQAIHGDLSEPGWRSALPPGPYDAAVSSFAIHHLPAEGKRVLFAETFELLSPGGMFINMDVVTIRGPLAGLFDEEIVTNVIRAERARGSTRSDEEIERETLDDSSDDRPDSAPDQLAWLAEVGFEDVELHFKWAEGAIYGGVKPA